MKKKGDLVIAKCPCCEKVYKTRIEWTGKSTPRIFCPLCKQKRVEETYSFSLNGRI